MKISFFGINESNCHFYLKKYCSRFIDTYQPITPIDIHSFALIASNGTDIYELVKNGELRTLNKFYA